MSEILIYKIFDKRDGACMYVGSSASHYFSTRVYLTRNSKCIFSKYLNDLGYHNFEFEVLETTNKSERTRRKLFWIENLEPICNVF